MFDKFFIRSSYKAARLSAVALASFVAASILLAAAPLRAASYSWAISAGDWSVASNWGSSLLPSSNDETYVVNGGTVSVTQLGETCDVLSLGSSAGSGAVLMTGGSLSASSDEYSGFSGTGTFSQSGGTNNVDTGYLLLGFATGSSGIYNLSALGVLSAYTENVGLAGNGTGTFSQSGGSNSVSNLNISNVGRYQFSGGTLQVNGFSNQGVFDVTNSTGVLNIAGNSIVDFSQAILVNTGSMSLSIGPNSILLAPANFNPTTAFRSYTNQGIMHNIGTPLTISAGQGFAGNGSVTDHVNCQGAIVAAGQSINLNGGLTVSGTGNASLGGGNLVVNDSVSGISGGSLVASSESIGTTGAGSFTQSGGTNTIDGFGLLNVGLNQGSSGTYNLIGSALLAASGEYVGCYCPGTFLQTSGTNTVGDSLSVGSGMGVGSYTLSGPGLLTANYEYLGWGGTGTFNQSAGTNHVTAFLNVGYSSNSNGSYTLSGSAVLVAKFENMGPFAPGTFTQTGGSNSAGYLDIFGQGRYTFSGGTLAVNEFSNQGIFDATGSTGVLNIAGSSIVDFSQAVLVNTGSMSLSIGPNSLLLLPGGFNPATAFGHYINAGILHYVGTPLTILSGQGFSGDGSVTDFTNCEGRISAVTNNGSISLNGGLTISGTGNVSLGSYGELYVDDSLSGMSGGSLAAATEILGYVSAGTFTQSGGTNSLSFSNSGLFVGYNAGSIYQLSGSGVLAAVSEYVGFLNTGTFNQSGGTNIVSTMLALGSNTGGSGSYNLSGGLLLLPALSQASGSAAFNFSGGTIQAGISFTTSLPMTLGTSAWDGATFDTAGYALTLSGSLSGPGGLTKVDSGTLTLATINTYSGNTLISGGMLALGSPLALENSTLDTSGSGALNFGSLTSATFGGLTGHGTLGLSNSASAAVALSVGNNNASTTYSGVLQGPGSLTKIGSGNLALSGTSTYLGPTTINQGKLVVDGWLTNSAVSVTGGTLGGTGHLSNVTVNAGGSLAPGDSLGTLNVNGNLILASSAVMDYELDTPMTSGLVSCGGLALSGQQFSDFKFTPTANFEPGVYDLIQFGSLSGGLGTSTTGAIDGYPATLSVQGNNLVLSVPEPSTLALLGAGVLGLMGWAWRRRSRVRGSLV